MKFITNESGKVLLRCKAECAQDVTEITVPDGIVGVDDDAFCGFDNLERVFLPDSVTWFENKTFHNMEKLEELVIPAVESFGPYPFSGCVALREFTVPPTVKRLGYAAFGGAKNLKRLVFTSIDALKMTDFGTFRGLSDEIDIVFPTQTQKPVIAYDKAFGAYDIDESLARELKKKSLLAQAQEFELREHSSPAFNPERHLMGSVNGFFDDYRNVKALISHDGLFVGYLLRVWREDRKESEKTVLVGETVWNGWERHIDTSGDNNGAGYKGGEDYYTKTYVTLVHS